MSDRQGLFSQTVCAAGLDAWTVGSGGLSRELIRVLEAHQPVSYNADFSTTARQLTLSDEIGPALCSIECAPEPTWTAR